MKVSRDGFKCKKIHKEKMKGCKASIIDEQRNVFQYISQSLATGLEIVLCIEVKKTKEKVVSFFARFFFLRGLRGIQRS